MSTTATAVTAPTDTVRKRGRASLATPIPGLIYTLATYRSPADKKLRIGALQLRVRWRYKGEPFERTVNIRGPHAIVEVWREQVDYLAEKMRMKDVPNDWYEFCPTLEEVQKIFHAALALKPDLSVTATVRERWLEGRERPPKLTVVAEQTPEPPKKSDRVERIKGELRKDVLAEVLAAVRPELSDLRTRVDALQREIAALRAGQLAANDAEPAPPPVSTNTLPDILELLEMLMPDRVRVLDSAKKSAQASRRFRYTERARDMLLNLATLYLDARRRGEPVQKAASVLGAAYADGDCSTLTERGRRLRTFTVDGETVFMDHHLKIGVKDSIGETWRLHFAVIDERIVIGHCGKHLDF